MQPRDITITPDQQQQLSCKSCSSVLTYAVIADIVPHLYCARCHNIYTEPTAESKVKGIWWQRRAVREQHALQSHAPVCECGGLFLFNAHPHCTHCGRPLTLPFPTDAKGRLHYSDMVVFHGTKLYFDNGTINLYQFA